jgi:hypothetical protein
MNQERYLVELEVYDLQDPRVGDEADPFGTQVLKFRFNLAKFDRDALRHALLDKILTSNQFPKTEEPKQ